MCIGGGGAPSVPAPPPPPKPVPPLKLTSATGNSQSSADQQGLMSTKRGKGSLTIALNGGSSSGLAIPN